RAKKSGIKANSASITSVRGAPYLKPPEHYAGCKTDLTRAWFCLSLPRPAQIVAIREAKGNAVTISGSKAPKGQHTYATGLRLIFNYDMDEPEFVLWDKKKEAFNTRLVDYSSPDSPIRFDITIRFGGPFVFDPNHDDAKDCFDASTRLFQHS